MTDTVEIELGERTETLRPTLRAAKAVAAIGGREGIAEVFRRLAVFDLECYVAVVAAGLGKRPSEVEDAVYKAGIDTLADPLARFVAMIARGGRPEAAGSDGETAQGEA